MIRLTGAVFLVVCGWGAGFGAAAKCRESLGLLERLDNYLACMAGELEYTAAPLCRIAAELARRPVFRDFSFARRCALAAEGEPFSGVFAAAGNACFGGEAADCIGGLSDQLGMLPVAGQLAAISLCRSRLQPLLRQKREETRASAALCRRLGLLAGAAAAVLLW